MHLGSRVHWETNRRNTMTSNVKVSAHCSPDKEVRVTVTGITDHATGEVGVIETFTLQDGETAERAIYDSHEVKAVEVLK